MRRVSATQPLQFAECAAVLSSGSGLNGPGKIAPALRHASTAAADAVRGRRVSLYRRMVKLCLQPMAGHFRPGVVEQPVCVTRHRPPLPWQKLQLQQIKPAPAPTKARAGGSGESGHFPAHAQSRASFGCAEISQVQGSVFPMRFVQTGASHKACGSFLRTYLTSNALPSCNLDFFISASMPGRVRDQCQNAPPVSQPLAPSPVAGRLSATPNTKRRRQLGKASMRIHKFQFQAVGQNPGISIPGLGKTAHIQSSSLFPGIVMLTPAPCGC